MDNVRDPESGFYWINFGTDDKIRKVWCDMTIDGGGFMLIGRKNSSTTWTVPSNDKPVDPFGEPHWSSALGDAPVLDFRIQVATSEDFQSTAAHWSFRLQEKRPLGNLMLQGEGGCDLFPGIGNISYVKDISTEKIVTSKFRCSQFGGFYQPVTGLGWVMMNSCLQKPCSWGFAYHHAFPYQIDYSGAFSYNTRYSVSGISHNATAFVGCDQGVCCGCFGPKGSLEDHCGPKCQALNGGTITNNIYTWFWMRSTLPKRIWKKCMEYTETNDKGQDVTYVINELTGVPKEGICGNNEVTLNDGIVVIPKSSTAERLPSVSGLLAYRSDDKKMYVYGNKKWQPLAKEKEVEQQIEDTVNLLNQTSKQLIGKISKLEQTVSNAQKKVNQSIKNAVNKMNGHIIDLSKKVSKLNETVFQEHMLVVDINTQECNSYTWLTSADRSVTYTDQSNIHCDSGISKGWYRFGQQAGTKMQTSCTPQRRCSTHVTTWINGKHPDVSSGIVDRSVCFHWNGRCCEWSHTIRVRNCGSFYVYELSPSTSGYCHYRYCGST